jgi:two-component system phosphate regulon sensor histidine kinase PhoR
MGSLFTAAALWHVRRTWRETEGTQIARLLFGAVIGFVLYAIFAGFIVEQAPIFPAAFANTAWFSANVGLPVQLVRTLCVLAIMAFMIRVYYFEAAHYVNLAYAAERQGVQRLEEMDRIKNDLSSMDRQEFRSALGSISRGSPQSVLGNLSKDPAQSRRAKVEEALEADPLRATLERIDSGTLALAPQPFRLVDALNVVFHRMTTLARARGIGLEMEHDESVEVQADLKLTEGILVNLIDNAIKYGLENSKVLVRVERRDGKALVSVQDQGPGIPPEQIGMLFGRFVRLRRPGQQSQVGSGLGLYVTKKLVEMQGGEIWVESEERKGSVFCFTLPMGERPAP